MKRQSLKPGMLQTVANAFQKKGGTMAQEILVRCDLCHHQCPAIQIPLEMLRELDYLAQDLRDDKCVVVNCKEDGLIRVVEI